MAFSIFVALSTSLLAQQMGSIVGRVTDQKGAVIQSPKHNRPFLSLPMLKDLVHRSGALKMKRFLCLLTSLLSVFLVLNGCGSSSGATSAAPATPTITWPTPAAISYGTALSLLQLNAAASYGGSSVPGTFAYTPAAGTVLTAGTQSLSVTFTPNDTTKFKTVTATNSIKVNQATPTINWGTPAAVTVGTTLSSTQLNATASFGGSTVPGTFVYSPAAGTVMNTVGTQTLSVTFTPADATDYTPATTTVSLTVNSALSSSCTASSYCWDNVRIVAGGYITGVYFHPTQQNLMYIRTDVGGAYRRGPQDSQWVPLLDFNSNGNWSGVEAIGMDPTDPNKLYIAVGEYTSSWAGNGAMMISSDQGATFKTVPLNFRNGANDSGRGTGDRIAVDPNLPSTVYFGTRTAGLQISTDSGNSWNQVTGLPVTGTISGDWGQIQTGVVSVLPIKSSGSPGSATPVVYAIVGDYGLSGESQGVYVSTNAGSTSSTWTPVAGQPSLTGASQNISETINGTQTLFSLAPLEAKAGPDGSIYILYGDMAGPESMNMSQLWKFVPGANWTSGTWTQIKLPNSVPGGIENYTPDGILYNAYAGLAVDPSHAGYLLLGSIDQYWPTGDVIYRSTDDGATWRDVSSVNTGGSSKSPNLATHDNTIAPYVGAPGTVSTGNWPTGIAIDPFNADRAMYGYGGGLWITTDLTKADPTTSSTGVVDWKFDDLGIEETAIEGLWAPPSGPTLLLSAIGDISGFAHTDLTVSPAQGNYTNPKMTPTSMDFEQNTPTTVVRVVNGQYGSKPLGTISTDGGMTWTGFGSNPSDTVNGGGTIAIAPDGSSMLWAPADSNSVWYSKDSGKTWTASTGIAAHAQVVSDRVKAGVFYGYYQDGTTGTLTMSTDGGATFTTVQTGLAAVPSWENVKPILYALPDAQGDLWLTAGASGTVNGLYTNTGSATSPHLTLISSVQQASYLGFGKAAPGSSKLTLFLNGTIGTQWGLFRSTDGGESWIRINDDQHQWGGMGPVCGDMRTFGTVYVAARGIIWGTSSN
jgi:hypothetical protein